MLFFIPGLCGVKAVIRTARECPGYAARMSLVRRLYAVRAARVTRRHAAASQKHVSP